MTVALVPLTAAALDVFAEMVEQLYLDDPGEQVMTRERARRQAARMLAEDAGAARPLIAHADDAVIGYAIVVPYLSNEYGGKVAVIDELFVRRDARGRGHGTAIAGELIEWARTEGFRFVMLEVNDDNAGARRLYERLGFVAQPRRTMALALE